MNAALFPGQGSQEVGMGKGLYDAGGLAKEWMDQADGWMGGGLLEVMFAGPDEQLRQTKWTQPALFLHSAVRWALGAFDVKAAAGHSLGEYSALFAAGALDFEDAFKLVRLRGALMHEAGESQPGSMAAVIGLPDDKVEALCATVASQTGSVLVPANYNSPGQLVVSGSVAAVHLLIEEAKQAGCKLAKELMVSGAFHSPLMASAAEGLAGRLHATDFKAPSFPVYSNVSAEAVTDPDILRMNVLGQLTMPVRWTQTMFRMKQDGISHFIEIGQGKVLQGLCKRTLEDVTWEGAS